MTVTFLAFCIAYVMITTTNIVSYLKSGTGFDAGVSIGYMATIVWLAIAVFTDIGKSGALWFVAIYSIIILLLIMLGAVKLKTLNKPSIIFAIIYKLIVITFAIGLAI